MELIKKICIVIWFLLVIMCTCMFISFQKTIKNLNTCEIEKSSLISESCEEIKVIIIEAPKIDYQTKILEVSKYWRNYDYVNENFSRELENSIRKTANYYNLDLDIAFAIVHIESDFKPNAYNKIGKAFGLCQITKPCLDEYNWQHKTNYTLEQMFDINLNLEVGFWYYNRILTHYDKHYNYITKTNNQTKLRDAYLAYNVGVTVFNKIGITGRNCLRNGIYPCNMYGAKKGEKYYAIDRFNEKISYWL